jgi:biotin transport system substrate-specific component
MQKEMLMSKAATQILSRQTRSLEWARQAGIIVAASLFVALCARVTLPLPTPVPLTLSNFGVLAVGLVLGSRRGFAALALYLAEGAAGLPVFTLGPGGFAQLLGPTGGFLIAYPFVALVAGWIYERSARNFSWAAFSGLVAEFVLFASGLSWLYVLTHSLAQTLRWGLDWFLFAELIKIMLAAAVAAQWTRRVARQS